MRDKVHLLRLTEKQTIDGRLGAIVQLWISETGKKSREKLHEKLGRRIRQGILVVPTTSVFEFFPVMAQDKFNMMDNVGHCEDGYEEIIDKQGRRLISIPIMMGHDFLVDEKISVSRGIMGGNLYLFCDSVDSGMRIGREAIKIILGLDDVCTTFDVCAAGSKLETNFPKIGPTTNHPFCPTLKDKLPLNEHRVPEGVKSIPEIVFNALDLATMRRAMFRVIQGIKDLEGLIKISAGNYGGKLGKYKIYLRELIKSKILSENWFFL